MLIAAALALILNVATATGQTTYSVQYFTRGSAGQAGCGSAGAYLFLLTVPGVVDVYVHDSQAWIFVGYVAASPIATLPATMPPISFPPGTNMAVACPS
jgi:hypothetical protein